MAVNGGTPSPHAILARSGTIGNAAVVGVILRPLERLKRVAGPPKSAGRDGVP